MTKTQYFVCMFLLLLMVDCSFYHSNSPIVEHKCVYIKI